MLLVARGMLREITSPNGIKADGADMAHASVGTIL